MTMSKGLLFAAALALAATPALADGQYDTGASDTVRRSSRRTPDHSVGCAGSGHTCGQTP